MSKSLIGFLTLIMMVSSIDGLAQSRTRVRKPQSGKIGNQKAASKPSEPEQKLIPSPFSQLPQPPPEGSPLWCPLEYNEGPDIVGLKLGTFKQEVLARARMAQPEHIDGWRLEPYLTYYNVYGDHAKNPLPDIDELKSIIDENNDEALGRTRSKPRYVPPPKLRVYDEATDTQVTEVKFGFYKERLFHIKASYFSTKTQWSWDDIQQMFANSGIQPSHWVRHTNIPMSPFYRKVLEAQGDKIYKQTAYCKGFYLTVQYSNKPTGFTIDIIHYPALAGGYKEWKAAQGDAKGSFKP